MKRMALFLILFLASAVNAKTYESDAPKNMPILRPRTGITICAQNGDIDQTFELMARNSAFAQIAATDSLELLGAQGADTVLVRVMGVVADSTRFDTILTVNGTTVKHTAARAFMYYEGSRLVETNDAPMTGALTIRRATGDTHISAIAIGERSDPVAQYFITKNENVAVAHWGAGVTTSTGITSFELRWYPDWRAARSSSTGMGYEVLDVIVFDTSVEGSRSGHILPDRPVVGTNKYLSRGWLAVFAKSSADNAAGFATLVLDIY